MITRKQFLSIVLLSLIGIWFFLSSDLAQNDFSSLSPPLTNRLPTGLFTSEMDSSRREQNRLNWNEYEQSLNNAEILECEPSAETPTVVDSNKSSRNIWEEAEALSNLPGLSKGPNNQVIAALLSSIYDEPSSVEVSSSPGASRTEKSLETFNDILQKNPQNSLASMHLLRACGLVETHPACNDQMIERAKVLNGDNSVFWSTLASLQLAEGKLDEAVFALQQATEAPEYDDYFSQHLELFHNAMTLMEENSGTPLSSPSNTQHYVTSIIYATSAGFGFGSGGAGLPIFNFCREQVSEREDIAEDCLNYGARMEKDGSTSMAHLLGISLQTQVSERLGNTELKQELEERGSIFRQNLYDDDLSKASDLMMHDELLAWDYFQTWIGYGELQAMQYVVEEARRLSADPGYDPCP